MPKDEFSELDYEPKKRAGCLVPLIVLILIVVLLGALIVFLGNRNFAVIDIDEVEEDEQLVDFEPVIPEPEEEVVPEQEEELEEETDEIPPDYDQLEAALNSWLTQRVSDPDVIMVHSSELDDVESFLESYSFEEDNVIVYQVDSTEDEFVTILFGLPYSEWSIRAVFIWRDSKWEFLREEPVS